MSATSPPARRARLARYARWHLRDYLRDKGIATLITLGLLGYLNQVPITRAREVGLRPDLIKQASDQAFFWWIWFLALLGAVFATNGIVADDRRHGYYRLLFAKPVSVVEYYAQKFVVYGLGYLIVASVLLAVYNAAVEPFFPPLLLPVLALVYVALGGIGFLLSAAWRFDWLSLTAVFGFSYVLWQLFQHDTGWRGLLLRVLPPVHLLDGVYTAIRHGQALPAHDLAWLAGYGLGCFVLGLAVVRWRPMVAS